MKRPPRPARIAEHALQATVREFLDLALPRTGCTWTSIDKALAGYKIGGANKRGIRDGWPDVHILCNGRAIYIELKADDGELRKKQEEVRDQILAAGGYWHEARTLDSVEGILRGHGIPLLATAGGFRGGGAQP